MQVILRNNRVVVVNIQDHIPDTTKLMLKPGDEIVEAPNHVKRNWYRDMGTWLPPQDRASGGGGLDPSTPKQIAGGLLLSSDKVIIRFYEEGQPVNDDWKNYRAALRRIVNGANDPMPPTPAEPW